MEPTISGWYDDELTGGYRWYSSDDQIWTMFTAPGLAEKAVKVAMGTATTKIFFYTTLTLWGLLKAQEYISSGTTFTTKFVTDVPYATLVLFVVLYYPVTSIIYELFRRVMLRELEKAIGYVVDSPPSHPPVLWLLSKEYLVYRDKVTAPKPGAHKPSPQLLAEEQSATLSE